MSFLQGLKMSCQNSRFNLRLRLLSLLMIFLFTWDTLTWANPDLRSGTFHNTPQTFAAILRNIDIPESMGRIESRYLSTTTPNPAPLIIHIRDAHAQAEAQKNIEAILDYLAKDKNIGIVAIEGAYGDVRSDSLKLFPGKEENEIMAQRLLEMGELTGPELFALHHNPGLPLYGVEDPKIYRRNFRLFRQVKHHKAEILQWIDAYRRILEGVEEKFFNTDLKSFVKARRDWEDSAEDSLEAFQSLKRLAVKHLALDLTQPRHQFQWPNLSRLIKAGEEEQNFSYEAAHADLEKLAGELKKNLPAGASRDFLTEGLGVLSKDSAGSAFRAWLASGNRFPEIKTTRFFFEMLYGAGKKNNQSLLAYPHFLQMAGLMILREEIDAQLLVKEKKTLEARLAVRLSRNAKEQALLQLDEDFSLVVKLANLTLTSEDDELYQVRRDRLQPGALQKRFEIFSGAQTKVPAPSGKTFKLAEEFYRVSRRRDQVLLNNTLRLAGQTKAKAVILITGGFHTDGFIRELKAKNISHLVITPKMATLENNNLYEKVMLGGNASLESFTAKNSNVVKWRLMPLMQSPDNFRLAGMRPEQTRNLVLNLWHDSLPRLRQRGLTPETLYQGVAKAAAALEFFKGTHIVFDDKTQTIRALLPHQNNFQQIVLFREPAVLPAAQKRVNSENGRLPWNMKVRSEMRSLIGEQIMPYLNQNGPVSMGFLHSVAVRVFLVQQNADSFAAVAREAFSKKLLGSGLPAQDQADRLARFETFMKEHLPSKVQDYFIRSGRLYLMGPSAQDASRTAVIEFAHLRVRGQSRDSDLESHADLVPPGEWESYLNQMPLDFLEGLEASISIFNVKQEAGVDHAAAAAAALKAPLPVRPAEIFPQGPPEQPPVPPVTVISGPGDFDGRSFFGYFLSRFVLPFLVGAALLAVLTAIFSLPLSLSLTSSALLGAAGIFSLYLLYQAVQLVLYLLDRTIESGLRLSFEKMLDTRLHGYAKNQDLERKQKILRILGRAGNFDDMEREIRKLDDTQSAAASNWLNENVARNPKKIRRFLRVLGAMAQDYRKALERDPENKAKIQPTLELQETGEALSVSVTRAQTQTDFLALKPGLSKDRKISLINEWIQEGQTVVVEQNYLADQGIVQPNSHADRELLESWRSTGRFIEVRDQSQSELYGFTADAIRRERGREILFLRFLGALPFIGAWVRGLDVFVLHQRMQGAWYFPRSWAYFSPSLEAARGRYLAASDGTEVLHDFNVTRGAVLSEAVQEAARSSEKVKVLVSPVRLSVAADFYNRPLLRSLILMPAGRTVNPPSVPQAEENQAYNLEKTLAKGVTAAIAKKADQWVQTVTGEIRHRYDRFPLVESAMLPVANLSQTTLELLQDFKTIDELIARAGKIHGEVEETHRRAIETLLLNSTPETVAKQLMNGRAGQLLTPLEYEAIHRRGPEAWPLFIERLWFSVAQSGAADEVLKETFTDVLGREVTVVAVPEHPLAKAKLRDKVLGLFGDTTPLVTEELGEGFEHSVVDAAAVLNYRQPGIQAAEFNQSLWVRRVEHGAESFLEISDTASRVLVLLAYTTLPPSLQAFPADRTAPASFDSRSGLKIQFFPSRSVNNLGLLPFLTGGKVTDAQVSDYLFEQVFQQRFKAEFGRDLILWLFGRLGAVERFADFAGHFSATEDGRLQIRFDNEAQLGQILPGGLTASAIGFLNWVLAKGLIPGLRFQFSGDVAAMQKTLAQYLPALFAAFNRFSGFQYDSLKRTLTLSPDLLLDRRLLGDPEFLGRLAEPYQKYFRGFLDRRRVLPPFLRALRPELQSEEGGKWNNFSNLAAASTAKEVFDLTAGQQKITVFAPRRQFDATVHFLKVSPRAAEDALAQGEYEPVQYGLRAAASRALGNPFWDFAWRGTVRGWILPRWIEKNFLPLTLAAAGLATLYLTSAWIAGVVIAALALPVFFILQAAYSFFSGYSLRKVLEARAREVFGEASWKNEMVRLYDNAAGWKHLVLLLEKYGVLTPGEIDGGHAALQSAMDSLVYHAVDFNPEEPDPSFYTVTVQGRTIEAVLALPEHILPKDRARMDEASNAAADPNTVVLTSERWKSPELLNAGSKAHVVSLDEHLYWDGEPSRGRFTLKKGAAEADRYGFSRGITYHFLRNQVKFRLALAWLTLLNYLTYFFSSEFEFVRRLRDRYSFYVKGMIDTRTQRNYALERNRRTFRGQSPSIPTIEEEMAPERAKRIILQDTGGASNVKFVGDRRDWRVTRFYLLHPQMIEPVVTDTPLVKDENGENTVDRDWQPYQMTPEDMRGFTAFPSVDARHWEAIDRTFSQFAGKVQGLVERVAPAVSTLIDPGAVFSTELSSRRLAAQIIVAAARNPRFHGRDPYKVLWHLFFRMRAPQATLEDVRRAIGYYRLLPDGALDPNKVSDAQLFGVLNLLGRALEEELAPEPNAGVTAPLKTDEITVDGVTYEIESHVSAESLRASLAQAQPGELVISEEHLAQRLISDGQILAHAKEQITEVGELEALAGAKSISRTLNKKDVQKYVRDQENTALMGALARVGFSVLARQSGLVQTMMKWVSKRRFGEWLAKAAPIGIADPVFLPEGAIQVRVTDPGMLAKFLAGANGFINTFEAQFDRAATGFTWNDFKSQDRIFGYLQALSQFAGSEVFSVTRGDDGTFSLRLSVELLGQMLAGSESLRPLYEAYQVYVKREFPRATAVPTPVRENFEAGNGPYSVDSKRVYTLSILARAAAVKLQAAGKLPKKGAHVKILVTPQHHKRLHFAMAFPRIARRVLKEDRFRINLFHIMEAKHFSIFWGQGAKYLMTRIYFRALKGLMSLVRKALYGETHWRGAALAGLAGLIIIGTAFFFGYGVILGYGVIAAALLTSLLLVFWPHAFLDIAFPFFVPVIKIVDQLSFGFLTQLFKGFYAWLLEYNFWIRYYREVDVTKGRRASFGEELRRIFDAAGSLEDLEATLRFFEILHQRKELFGNPGQIIAQTFKEYASPNRYDAGGLLTGHGSKMESDFYEPEDFLNAVRVFLDKLETDRRQKALKDKKTLAPDTGAYYGFNPQGLPEYFIETHGNAPENYSEEWNDGKRVEWGVGKRLRIYPEPAPASGDIVTSADGAVVVPEPVRAGPELRLFGVVPENKGRFMRPLHETVNDLEAQGYDIYFLNGMAERFEFPLDDKRPAVRRIPGFNYLEFLEGAGIPEPHRTLLMEQLQAEIQRIGHGLPDVRLTVRLKLMWHNLLVPVRFAVYDHVAGLTPLKLARDLALAAFFTWLTGLLWSVLGFSAPFAALAGVIITGLVLASPLFHRLMSWLPALFSGLNLVYAHPVFRWGAAALIGALGAAMFFGFVPVSAVFYIVAPAALILLAAAPFFSWLFRELAGKTVYYANWGLFYILTRSPRYIQAAEEFRAWQDDTLGIYPVNNLPPKIRAQRALDAWRRFATGDYSRPEDRALVADMVYVGTAVAEGIDYYRKDADSRKKKIALIADVHYAPLVAEFTKDPEAAKRTLRQIAEYQYNQRDSEKFRAHDRLAAVQAAARRERLARVALVLMGRTKMTDKVLSKVFGWMGLQEAQITADEILDYAVTSKNGDRRAAKRSIYDFMKVTYSLNRIWKKMIPEGWLPEEHVYADGKPFEQYLQSRMDEIAERMRKGEERASVAGDIAGRIDRLGIPLSGKQDRWKALRVLIKLWVLVQPEDRGTREDPIAVILLQGPAANIPD